MNAKKKKSKSHNYYIFINAAEARIELVEIAPEEFIAERLRLMGEGTTYLECAAVLSEGRHVVLVDELGRFKHKAGRFILFGREYVGNGFIHCLRPDRDAMMHPSEVEMLVQFDRTPYDPAKDMPEQLFTVKVA